MIDLIDHLPTGIWIGLIAMILLSAFVLLFDYWRRSRQRTAQAAAPFASRPVLSRDEANLFHQIEERLPSGHRVLAQFPYAKMLEGGIRGHAINTQRADLVIVDAAFNVVAVINYLPLDQNGNTERATIREAQKILALKEAGLPLLRIPTDYTNSTIEGVLQSISIDQRASS